MFDISWTELMVIGVVALIAIGPKELPGVLRTVGQWAGKARRLAGEFQGQFREAMREAEMAELKKSFDEVKSATSAFAAQNPLTSLQKEVEGAMSVTPPPAASLPAPAAEQIAAETLAAVEAHAMQTAVAAPLAIVPEAVAAATPPVDNAAPKTPVAQDQPAQDPAQDQMAKDQVAKDQTAS